MVERCIIVADGARARFIVVEEAGDPQFESGPRLVEHRALVNPEAEIRSEDLFSDVRSGRGHAAPDRPAYGLDDHRLQHRAANKRRFAKLVAEALVEIAGQRQLERIILVAEPRMLGMLRAELDVHRLRHLERAELAEDLSWHSVEHIQEVLVRHGLLPPPHPPTGGYRAPGQPSPAR